MARTLRLLRTCTIVVLTCCLAGCNWFGGGKSKSASESVFSVQPGQCFVAPATVKAELSDLTQTPCTQPHTQEAYAIVQYQAGTTSASNSAFPGNDVLSTFAQGACAQHYADYVGVDYLDSKLFFTYLLPSPRSWEQNDDYKIICFVTTTGATLTSSVKGSKK